MWFANVITLLVGSIVIYFLYEGLIAFFAGSRSFSLPLAMFLIIPLFGGVLAIWFSWKSTAIILGLYSVSLVLSAILEIISDFSDGTSKNE